jgi:hypothetical protein
MPYTGNGQPQNRHQIYQSAAQNGMQFAYATNSCSDKRVLLGQSVVLIDVPTEDVSY